MNKKIPLFCKIKKHITIPSPSASMFCKCGFKFRPNFLCKNCPANLKKYFWGLK